ncbi:MAG: hypothetical protein Q9190_002168 [Brigantiaea leucoxantha]
MTLSILITGGSGFVGSAIVDVVAERHPDWAITVLDLQEPSNAKNGVLYEKGDVTDAAAIREIFKRIEQPTVVIHAAGMVPDLADRYGRNLQQEVFRVNVEGTRNVLAAAQANGNVNTFVYTGSFTAVTDDMTQQYPNIDESWPISSHSLIYGESKARLLSS